MAGSPGLPVSRPNWSQTVPRDVEMYTSAMPLHKAANRHQNTWPRAVKRSSKASHMGHFCGHMWTPQNPAIETHCRYSRRICLLSDVRSRCPVLAQKSRHLTAPLAESSQEMMHGSLGGPKIHVAFRIFRKPSKALSRSAPKPNELCRIHQVF